jgi:hypothetical protein
MKIEELQKAYEYLEENGQLEYGHTIPKKVIEKVLGMNYQDHISFIGPYLQLKQFIEDNGYLVHTRLEQCELILYDTDEIAYRADKIMKNNMNRIKRLQNCLLHIKSEEFSQKDLMKYLHSTTKVTASLNALNSTLASV